MADVINTMLVAGATGLVGAAAVEHFAAQPGWQVIALSRRPPAAGGPKVRHISCDLADAAACKAALAGLADVTHVLYAALYEKADLVAGWRDHEQMQTNLSMLRNLLDALQPVAPKLQHLSLLQGTKAYGSHVGPVRTPLKERWPRHPHENFYWLQEDLLRQRQPGSGWTFTILRPQVVLGYAVASPMNVVASIGAYAAVMRELGRPLCFPGGGAYVNAASDSRLIAAAAQFVATHAVAANETYNVANGDVIVWQDLFPAVAAHFGMPLGERQPMQLAKAMPDFEAAWAKIVEQHGLKKLTLAELIGSSWQFTDRTFAHGIEAPIDAAMSTIKLRQAGFADCLDSEDALIYWLTRMQEQRFLPL